jgi:hypothetical protein
VVAALEALVALVATCLGNEVVGPLLGNGAAASPGPAAEVSSAQQALQQLQQLSLSAASAAPEAPAAALELRPSAAAPPSSSLIPEGPASSDPSSLRVAITAEWVAATAAPLCLACTCP